VPTGLTYIPNVVKKWWAVCFVAIQDWSANIMTKDIFKDGTKLDTVKRRGSGARSHIRKNIQIGKGKNVHITSFIKNK